MPVVPIQVGAPMALNDAAADAAVDAWVAAMSPPSGNPSAVAAAMYPLVRAIYAGIVSNAVIVPGTMTADGDPVIGAGAVT